MPWILCWFLFYPKPIFFLSHSYNSGWFLYALLFRPCFCFPFLLQTRFYALDFVLISFHPKHIFFSFIHTIHREIGRGKKSGNVFLFFQRSISVFSGKARKIHLPIVLWIVIIVSFISFYETFYLLGLLRPRCRHCHHTRGFRDHRRLLCQISNFEDAKLNER